MIKLGNVIVQSNWDSGTHVSFSCGIENPNNPYTLRTLDQIIGSEGIDAIEQMIAQKVYELMEAWMK
jgi:hypothetical protein